MQTIATLVALAAALAAGQGPRNLLTGGLSEQTLAAAAPPSLATGPALVAEAAHEVAA